MLRVAKSMETIIGRIAHKHGLDLGTVGAHLRLEQSAYMPLVIESLPLNQISVAHYYRQNGDSIADPEVVFLIHPALGWVPIEITQPPLFIIGKGAFSGHRRYIDLDENGKLIAYNRYWQNDLASFCGTWAANIRDQGWLEHGVKAE